MNKLKGMEVFVQIVQCGSLTGAAEQLGISLTSVVRALAALEKHLNVRLLNRSTRHIALTEEGREYLGHCQNILSEVTEAEARLAERALEPVGKITLTAPVTFGRMHVGPLINDFLQHYPKIQIELILTDRSISLLDEEIDLAVRIGHLHNSNLVARPVGRVRQVLCASPDYLQQSEPITTVQELEAHQCIHLTALNRQNVWEFKTSEGVLRMPFQHRLMTNQVDIALDACIKGLGCCRFLHYQVKPALDQNLLALVLPQLEPSPLPVQLLYPQTRWQSTRLKVLIEWLIPRLQITLKGINEG